MDLAPCGKLFERGKTSVASKHVHVLSPAQKAYQKNLFNSFGYGTFQLAPPISPKSPELRVCIRKDFLNEMKKILLMNYPTYGIWHAYQQNLFIGYGPGSLR